MVLSLIPSEKFSFISCKNCELFFPDRIYKQFSSLNYDKLNAKNRMTHVRKKCKNNGKPGLFIKKIKRTISPL